ncbi:polysaccharide deacetylase family protein [Sphingobacterium mizutaii]|uniref:polysaccharide deacetylase family protein n=1 Tax=Sphingobacterium mizutaii TaxID=1010 RepID=UPI0028997C83|nr:polysaccharide deacetylase family protein [Sphingobacterium mizutaii]
MIFTGDEFREGLQTVAETLEKENVKGSFFVTGRFLEDQKSAKLLYKLYRQGHYVGPHSDQHLLYAPWENRDSLLLSKTEFVNDLQVNLGKLHAIGIKRMDKFVAPYEWYNKQIAAWTKELGMDLYNFTPGLRTAADYTYPEMGTRYLSSEAILKQLTEYEQSNGLNGFQIIVHLGTDPKREDKLFNQLERLIDLLKNKNYKFVPLDEI